jgi:hypothetical protein
MTLAVACSSGGYRVAFIQGVLDALETAGLHADAYGGTSASVIPAALTAVGSHRENGLKFVKGMLAHKALGRGMSGVMQESIADWGPFVRERLWQPGQPRLCVPVSAVVTAEAASHTQGETARHLGRKLLLAAAHGNRNWAETHFKLMLFDTESDDPTTRLTADNFDAVAYASSRMLHAWDVPAWIGEQAVIDGSYTCSCPALEMAQWGYDEVIAISAEHGPLHHDLFGEPVIPDWYDTTPIHVIRPDVDLLDLGVDYTQASEKGLLEAFRHGENKGREFLSK